MKGIVFTEFLDMVEQQFSANMVDDIIDDCQLASGGAYTAVGTYLHQEMVELVLALAKRTNTSPPTLLKAFGEYLFGQFVKNYPRFFQHKHDAFAFLNGIEDIIHAEVRKLYPDAELPHFWVEEYTSQKLILIYTSSRHFEDLAEGLIVGCLNYFNANIRLTREAIHINGEQQERFILTRQEH